MTKNWTVQHDSGSQMALTKRPRDARALRLLIECGYTHAYLADGTGWVQLSILLRRAETFETVFSNALRLAARGRA